MNIFCFKVCFFSVKQHHIPVFCFSRPLFFQHHATFLSFVFIDAPSTFTRNKMFCEHTGPLRVNGIMRHFQKEIRIPVTEKVVSESCRARKALLNVSNLFSEVFIKTSWHISKSFRFLSLRYSADFRRSRLVHLAATKNL